MISIEDHTLSTLHHKFYYMLHVNCLRHTESEVPYKILFGANVYNKLHKDLELQFGGTMNVI